jgi:SAM-dependent methyltransferase
VQRERIEWARGLPLLAGDAVGFRPFCPGMAVTRGRIMPIPSLAAMVSRLRRDGLARSCRYSIHRIYNEYWDRRLGIQCAGSYRLASEGITNRDFHDYSPSSYLDLRRALDRIRGVGADDVFLDLGSGKGGVVLMAATRPFRKVIGVEISPRLHEVALSNLAKARARLCCPHVEFHVADVTRYRIPSDVTVIFLYNPFGGATLGRVLAEIRRSVTETPRRLVIICATPDRLIRALAGQYWITRIGELSGLRRYIFYGTREPPDD